MILKMQQSGVETCGAWRNCDSISHKHCVTNWRNLVRLWRAQKLCDVTINVNGCRFQCHGIVPASASPFFREAFCKKVEMSATDSFLCDKEVIVDFMSEETFSHVLNFMYTAEVDIRQSNVRPLVLAAARLEMQGMVNAIMSEVLERELSSAESTASNSTKQKVRQPHRASKTVEVEHRRRHKNGVSIDKIDCCGRFPNDDSSDAEEPLNVEDRNRRRSASTDTKITVVGIMDELRLQGDLKTLEFVRNFAARNFSRVSQVDSFLDTSVHTVACLLDDERLNIDEFKVFTALCRWLEADPLHLVHAPYLLSKLRLQLLSPQELEESVETKDYLMSKKKCRVLILEAFRFHCLRTRAGDDESTSRGTPRGQTQRIGTSRNYDSEAEDWTFGEDKVMVKKNQKSPFCPVKPCACCPDYILLSGGIDIKEKLPCEGLYKYEEKENAWLRFAKIPQPRNHHAAVYCKGAVYVIGGSDPTLTGPGSEVCPVATCYKLGLGSLKWCKVESMSTPRMSLQAVYLSGYIYAIGGQDHKQRILRDVERYSLSRCTWEYSGTLSGARAGMAACAFDNRLWALGGYCHKRGTVLDTVETFEEDVGSWENMIPLRFPRCFANAAACHGRLHILGGAWLDPDLDCTTFSSVYDVDVFNDVSKVWEGVTALRLSRHDAGVAVLGPRIYIVGGKHCDSGVIQNLETVECFDVEKGDWLEGVTSLPLPLLGPAVTYTS